MKKSNKAAQPNESGSATVKAAWIGVIGVIIAALIAAGVSFLSSQSPSNSNVTQTVTGNGATAISAGRDANVNQK